MQQFNIPEVPTKSFISVEVIEPITITVQEESPGPNRSLYKTSFTSYLVKVKTNHWAFANQRSEVRRRYSEFLWLRSKLNEHYPDAKLPKLPPKRYLHLTQFNSKLITERCAGLQKFLQEITQSPLFISDPAVLMFLQTHLTIPEMERELVYRANAIKGIAMECESSSPVGVGGPIISSPWDNYWDTKSDLTSSSSTHGSIYSGTGGYTKSAQDVERELDNHEAKIGFLTNYENPDHLLHA